MRKSLLLVLALGAVVACKTDKPEGASASGAAGPAATETGGPPPRSATIELPKRTRPATDDLDDDRGATMQGRAERRKQRLAALDTDGDGEISDEERAAARELRRAERDARLDTDGDGTVSDAERAAARRERASNLHGRLDGDGDGKLTAAELDSVPLRRFDPVAADDDGDGVVSVDELDKALQQRGDRRIDRSWRGGRGGAGGRGGEPPAPLNPVPAQ